MSTGWNHAVWCLGMPAASEELSEEKIIAIAKEHGVEAWFEASDPASQTKKLNFTTEEEYHEYFSSIGALNRDISESNERNRQRNVELAKALALCQTHKDTLRTYLEFSDIVTMDRAGIEECIELGLLTKYDRRAQQKK